MHVQLRLFAIGIMLAAVSACSTSQTKPARMTFAPRYSGFLHDYNQLKAAPDDPSYLRYLAPGVQARAYRKFIVDQPVFIINTGGQFQPLDPARVLSASQYYRARMTAALSAHYQVVNTPGAGVARLRVAVVGLVEVRPPLEAGDFIPLKALFNAGRMVAGLNPYVLRMSIESEALDSQTGRVLGAAVDSRETVKTVAGHAPPAEAQLNDLIDFWVARFVARLDKANGSTD